MSFGRFPSAWIIAQRRLQKFSAATRPGEHIAALKLYLVVAAYCDFASWTATLSLSDLEELTKLSRPMLISGSKLLVQEGLILKGRSKQKSTYQMVRVEDRWAKIPQDVVRRGLKSIPNRGRYALASLRIYILLLAMRSNTTNKSSISYDKIASYTGIRPADIRTSVSFLINAGLLNVVRAKYDDYDEEAEFSHNIYVLSGDFEGALPRHKTPKFPRPQVA
jgi:hypothetical protein